MGAAVELAESVGRSPACRAFSIPRASFYRRLVCKLRSQKVKPPPPRALSPLEEQSVLDVLHVERFMDKAVPEVYATLLDEGKYLCSISTMYRILRDHAEVRERRNVLRHPQYKKPELLATAPNQVWSWDITKLLSHQKWVYFYLYVILDIFSRYVVGWMVAHCEAKELARRLIEETCEKERIKPGQLTLHSDNGPAMISKPVALLMADLGITKTHSRPHVSNDNPFSESQFKTLKYSPFFPERFGSVEEVRRFGQPFFHWYNWEHRHSGIGLLTPGDVHYGKTREVLQVRQTTLNLAYAAHPERFVRKTPEPPIVPDAVWINPPAPGTGPRR